MREAARIGFTHAIVPTGTESLDRVGLKVLRTGDLASALRALP